MRNSTKLAVLGLLLFVAGWFLTIAAGLTHVYGFVPITDGVMIIITDGGLVTLMLVATVIAVVASILWRRDNYLGL